MKKKNSNTNIYIITALFIGLLGGYLFTQSKPNNNRFNNQDKVGQSQAKQNSKNNCLADDCLLVEDLEYPVDNLPTEVKNALDEAINDEYKALSTYEAVMDKFGVIRPFSMIKGAEEQHIASLKAIYDKYGLEIPENTWPAKVTTPETLRKACQIGVDAEIENAALYKDNLLPAVTKYEDITAVFTNLMNASEQKHLPAFEKCN